MIGSTAFFLKSDRKYPYVPEIFAIDDDGYSDYVIMSIDENGFISDWKIDNEDIDIH